MISVRNNRDTRNGRQPRYRESPWVDGIGSRTSESASAESIPLIWIRTNDGRDNGHAQIHKIPFLVGETSAPTRLAPKSWWNELNMVV